MPSWTSVPAWLVGEALTKLKLDKAPTAIGELQAWADDDDDRIATLESFVGTGSTRPQLRVHSPASNTINTVVPYATVRKDSHSGWSGASNYRYTVPISGLYLIQVQFKASAAAATPAQHFQVNGTGELWSAALASASYNGGHLGGILDLTSGDLCRVVENFATYTPTNDGAGATGLGSNYLAMTYIGPTT